MRPRPDLAMLGPPTLRRTWHAGSTSPIYVRRFKPFENQISLDARERRFFIFFRFLFMTILFQSQHASMLLKYAGISFISGAVNHGFFSGERSLWTAAIGVLLFVLGAWWEHHLTHATAETPKTLLQTLLWGTLLSIGLGFFTGGLQHFPDSPARSAWVVPAGFFMSVVALAMSGGFYWQRGAWVYVVSAGLLTSGSSYAAWQWLEAHPQAQHGHEASAPLLTQTIGRSVTIRMDDAMRFTPNTVPVQAGETIRFIVHNGGATAHEFVLGTSQEVADHAALMRDMAAGKISADSHQHGTRAGAALRVEAGKTGEVVVTFPTAQTLEMACLIPGHWEAGMRGKIEVGNGPVPGAAPASAPASAPATPDGHDSHAQHSHQH
jgi:uncharacterized cupredoxin-like copper-binding protein